MHDVIVVGAGPAGNVAARNLAGLGYSVVVIDWRRDIGDKLCTGIIGQECVDRFPPNESQVYYKARTATIVSPEGNRYPVARNETQAYVIDRVSYVDSLAQRAMEAGAQYELGMLVASIEVSDRGVVVRASRGLHAHRFTAEMVIVASGFRSPLLDMAGLGNGNNGHDYMVGAQAEVVVNELEDTEVYLGKDIAPGSFGWLVPLPESRALIGIVSRQKLNGHMSRFLSRLQTSGKIGEVIKRPRRWGIPLKPLAKTYRDRVIAVGDAAGLAKPTTGGGIYYALISGEMASDAADGAFVAGDWSARRLSGYEKRWRAVFGRELRIGYYARRLYEALGDRQIESVLRETLSSEAQEDLIRSRAFSFDWHSAVILKTIGRRGVGHLIRSFGPTVAPFLSRLAGARRSSN